MRSVVIGLLLALLGSISALAQEAPPALIVTLHDTEGVGVSGIMITVTDRSGGTVLARGTTGSDGSLRIAALPIADVRVQIHGQLPDGTSLSLPGQDSAGIAVTLGVPEVTLALRSEADGRVRPDPDHLTLEPGIPLTEVPHLTVLPMVTPVPTLPALLTTTVPTEALPAESGTSIWPGIILLTLLLLGLLGIFLIQTRGRVA